MGAPALLDLDVERSLYWDCLEYEPPATLLLMICRLYCDESRTGGKDGPHSVMTLGGWAVPQDCLRSLNRAWRAVLKDRQFGVQEAKARDLFVREGEFVGWTEDRAEAFRARLSRVIHDHALFGVACSVIVEDYDRAVADILPRRTVYRQAYVWVLQTSLEFAVDAEELRKRDRLLVIPDDGIPHVGRVKRSFYEMVDDLNGPIGKSGRLVRRFDPMESFQVCGLQAADMLAYGVRVGTQDRIRGITPGRIAVHGLVDVKTPILGGYYNEAAMRRSLEPFRIGLVDANIPKPLPPSDVPYSPAKKRRRGL